MKGAAHFSAHHDKGFAEIGVDLKYSNEKLLSQLTHEFRHAKQDKLMYQVADREKLISVYKPRLKECCPELPTEGIEENAILFADEHFKFYEKLGVKKIDSSHKNYDWGVKTLESMKTWANKSKDVYHDVFYETDAKNAANMMVSLLGLKI